MLTGMSDIGKEALASLPSFPVWMTPMPGVQKEPAVRTSGLQKEDLNP